jgi:hypothetical protein
MTYERVVKANRHIAMPITNPEEHLMISSLVLRANTDSDK